jgi:hypothetical protein
VEARRFTRTRSARGYMPVKRRHASAARSCESTGCNCAIISSKRCTVTAPVGDGVTEVKGEEHFVHAGEVLPPNHPVVKARTELFEPEVATPKSTHLSAKSIPRRPRRPGPLWSPPMIVRASTPFGPCPLQ